MEKTTLQYFLLRSFCFSQKKKKSLEEKAPKGCDTKMRRSIFVTMCISFSLISYIGTVAFPEELSDSMFSVSSWPRSLHTVPCPLNLHTDLPTVSQELLAWYPRLPFCKTRGFSFALNWHLFKLRGGEP